MALYVEEANFDLSAPVLPYFHPNFSTVIIDRLPGLAGGVHRHGHPFDLSSQELTKDVIVIIAQ
jgi:hypothetical protein